MYVFMCVYVYVYVWSTVARKAQHKSNRIKHITIKETTQTKYYANANKKVWQHKQKNQREWEINAKIRNQHKQKNQRK